MAQILNRLAGVTSVTIDGMSFNALEASYSTNSIARETLPALNQIPGFKETPVTGKIIVTLYDAGSTTVNQFMSLTSSTVQIVSPNGKVIVGTNMYVTGVQTVNVAEGSFEVTFEGVDVFENTVS
jgi:Phage tail tube protein